MLQHRQDVGEGDLAAGIVNLEPHLLADRLHRPVKVDRDASALQRLLDARDVIDRKPGREPLAIA